MELEYYRKEKEEMIKITLKKIVEIIRDKNGKVDKESKEKIKSRLEELLTCYWFLLRDLTEEI